MLISPYFSPRPFGGEGLGVRGKRHAGLGIQALTRFASAFNPSRSMPMNYEVEQKFHLVDPAAASVRLKVLGARQLEEVVQRDQYFNHPSRDFAQTDEALRIRRIGDACRLTYKGPKIDTETKTRQEIELPICSDPADGEKFADVLVALGFRPVAEVKKSRRTLHLQWQGREVEVALDTVIGLGDFLEIELQADDASLAEAKACLHSLATELGLGQPERRSYLEMLLEKSS